MSEVEKLKKLLDILELGELANTVEELGPFALFSIWNTVFAICDNPEAFDRWELERQMSELREEINFQNVHMEIVTGQQILARLLTQGEYSGFHDGMGWSIGIPSYLNRGFFGMALEPKPDYRKIKSTLEQAGYKFSK